MYVCMRIYVRRMYVCVSTCASQWVGRSVGCRFVSLNRKTYAMSLNQVKFKKDIEEKTFGKYIFLQFFLLMFSNSVTKDNNKCPADTIIITLYWN